MRHACSFRRISSDPAVHSFPPIDEFSKFETVLGRPIDNEDLTFF
jgi:hypothetical protein